MTKSKQRVLISISLIALCQALTGQAVFTYAQTTDAGISQALQTQLQSEKVLEELEKKSVGTPKEHELLVRLMEALMQIDRLARQKMIAANASGGHETRNLEFQKRIEYFANRFIAIYPTDPKLYAIYAIRARSREEVGNTAGLQQDDEQILKLAPKNSSEWLKASVKLGELYRAKGDLAKSEELLNGALKVAQGEWVTFILESLLQTQTQGREDEKALLTLNQIIFHQQKSNPTQMDGLMTAKGQLLGKLLVDSKIGLDTFYREISTYPASDRVKVLRTAMVEFTVVNNEPLALSVVQHPSYRALDSQSKIVVSSDLSSLLYDQRGYDVLLTLVSEMQTYAAPVTQDAKLAPQVEAGLKKLTELSQKVQGAIKRDPKLAQQSEGKVLEGLYSVIGQFSSFSGKANVKGDSINAEAKYNKASLFLVQDRPDAAYPIFKELGAFRDSEDKFHYALTLYLKRTKVIPESWEFTNRNPASTPVEEAQKPKLLQDLNQIAVKYCALSNFKADLCFDAMKGLVKLGKTDTVEAELRPIVFDAKRADLEKEQAFSALFDFYQANHQGEKSTQLLSEAEKQGIHLGGAVVTDAKKVVKNQSLTAVQKMFDEGKNAEIVSYAKQFETNNEKQVFPELFAFAGLAAQRLGQDEVALSYYGKFDQLASDQSKISDPAFFDLVAVGQAIAYERALDYSKAAFWWTKVRVWKDSSQKKLALNSIWLAGDLVKFKTLLVTPGFCLRADAPLCDEYKKLFVATWSVYTKEFAFQKTNMPRDILDYLVQLQIQDPKSPIRLKWVTSVHDAWTTMDPVRQVALYPNFQKYLKAEIQNWTQRETEKFGKVNTLMGFQAALKNLKADEAQIAPLARSNWTDFQVYTDIADALVYQSLVDALDRAKLKDQATLDSDPSIKKLFDDTSASLVKKQKEIMARGLANTKNFSLDLSFFEGLTQKYPEWETISKEPTKTSPAIFYASLTGKAKLIKDQWQAAFKTYNWAKVGYCVVQFSQDKSIPQNVGLTFEAETFLRFGNRIDSQGTLAQLHHLPLNAPVVAPAVQAIAVEPVVAEPATPQTASVAVVPAANPASTTPVAPVTTVAPVTPAVPVIQNASAPIAAPVEPPAITVTAPAMPAAPVSQLPADPVQPVEKGPAPASAPESNVLPTLPVFPSTPAQPAVPSVPAAPVAPSEGVTP